MNRRVFFKTTGTAVVGIAVAGVTINTLTNPIEQPATYDYTKEAWWLYELAIDTAFYLPM
ncbi:MAG: hypothetical protein KAS32_00360 [Candidatus Peribacteraceae bacterium]|nr:hypothetical protein [Candidatus Peribacteraceae bacterium]